MAFPLAAAALIGGGLVAGGLGSIFGARSANRAADRQQQAQQAEVNAARRRAGFLFFGPEDYEDFELATQPTVYQTQRRRGGLGGLFGGTRTSTVDQTDRVTAARNRFFGKYRPIDQELRDLGEQAAGRDRGNLEQTRRNTGELLALAGGQEGAIQDVADQGAARVRRDLTRANEEADQRATAILGMMGPSTLLANQLAGNRRRFAESESDALGQLDETRLQRLLQQRGQRLSLLAGRRALEEDLGRQVDQRRYLLDREPLDARQAVLSQGAFQPYTPVMGGTQSPAGNALASLSGSLSLLGGLGLSAGESQGAPQGMWTGRSAADFARIKGYR